MTKNNILIENLPGKQEAAIMNSSDIQRAFPHIYKDFYNAQDMVIGAPSILTWGTDISHGVSVLRIKQKLPLKTYCGVTLNNTGKITFGTMSAYNIVDNSFKKDYFSTFFRHDFQYFTSFLEDFLKDHNVSQGIHIDFLSEAPPGHGFAFGASVSVLLTVIVHIVSGKLAIESLEDGELHSDHPLFNVLYLWSLELSNVISQRKNIGGSSNYAVLLSDTPSPIVYFSQKNSLNHANDTALKAHSSTDISGDADMAIYKDTLINFLSISASSPWDMPFDYGIMFTGLEYRFGEIESKRAQHKNEQELLDLFIHESIGALDIGEKEKSMLHELLSFKKSEVLYKSIDTMNLKILSAFNSLFKNPLIGDPVDSFLQTLQQIGLSSFSYQKTNKLFFALNYYFHQYRVFEDEDIAILPFNTGRIGGSLLFVMKKGRSQATLTKTLERLKSDGYNILLDHASWRDGYSSQGVQIDQYISQKIYSDYTKAGDVFYSDSFGSSYSGNYDSIIQNETEGILLDTIGGRIYIQGKKLTSKDIHSQNTTIDMLKILLEQIGEEVSNSRLPVSTYSQNKNEILSKVIIPLRRITKEYFDQEVSLSCSGGITEYYLRLEKDETIKIGIIKTLQS